MEEKIQLTLDAEQKPDDALLDSVPTMQSVVKKRKNLLILQELLMKVCFPMKKNKW